MVMVGGGARSASKRLGWEQQTRCPRVEFQVAVETQARARETQGFKTCSTKLRDWLERKQDGFAFVSLWCFPSHHRDNGRWEVKITQCLKADSKCPWT